MRLGHVVTLGLGIVACGNDSEKPPPCTVEVLTEQARSSSEEPVDCGSFAPGDDPADGLACAESNFAERSAFFVVINDRVFSHGGEIGEPVIETFCVGSEVRLAGRDAGRLDCGDGADGGVACDLL